jgi:hypothetical protein
MIEAKCAACPNVVADSERSLERMVEALRKAGSHRQDIEAYAHQIGALCPQCFKRWAHTLDPKK